MNIYLIRHGITAANEQHLYCGSTDLSLSLQGRQELLKLHYDIPDVCFMTSGMKRAEETLLLLFGKVPHKIEPRFREIDFGVFEMHSYEQLKDRSDYQIWITGDNDANVPPEGESGKAMTRRVMEAFYQLRQDTCIITHGGCIAAIMKQIFPQEGKNRYQWQPKPGHGYCITDNTYYSLP